MMIFKRSAAVIALTLSIATLAGCASGASESVSDRSLISQIVVGRSTKQDVLSRFGEPQERTADIDGGSTWSYQRVQSTPLAFVPGLNMLGHSMNESALQVRFSKKGVVTGIENSKRSL